MLDYKKLLGISKLAKEANYGESIKIAVIDTDEPTLETNTQGRFVNFTTEPTGLSNHATFVGSILVGSGDLLGICDKATVYFAKVFSNNVASPEIVAEAIKYAVDFWGVDIINLSLGFSSSISCNPRLREACEYAHSKNVLLVAAAGNNEKTTMWPAALPEVISVGSIGAKLPNDKNIDILAPGTDIYGCISKKAPETRSGTSYATAIITGLLTLILGKSKKLNAIITLADAIVALLNVWKEADSEESDHNNYYSLPLPPKTPLYLRIWNFFGRIKTTIKNAFKAIIRRK